MFSANSIDRIDTLLAQSHKETQLLRKLMKIHQSVALIVQYWHITIFDETLLRHFIFHFMFINVNRGDRH